MLSLLIAVGVARAAPSSGWSAQAIGFTGIEQWSGTGSAVGGLRGAAGLDRRRALHLRATLSSEVLWWTGTPYDLHLGELALAGRGAVAPGGSVVVLGSAASGFTEVTPSATLALRRADQNLQILLGPAARLGDEIDPSLGGSAAEVWSLALRPELTVWARLDGDLWPSQALPNRLGSDLGASWSLGPNLTLSGGAGLSLTAGETTDWVAGLPPGGSRILRGRLIAERRLTTHTGVRGELLGDRFSGGVAYGHARVTVGLTARLGRIRTMPGPPEPTRFTLAAPEAATVSLAGSFSDWTPIPMSRDDRGDWRVELTLPAGIYEYIYLIDGQPLTPPEATRRQDDGFGGENGVLVVD